VPSAGSDPFTLAVDCGGGGIKASVLDAAGTLHAPAVRVPTPYPLPPERLVATIADIAAGLPPADRATVGMPGMLRHGVVVATPHYVTRSGPRTAIDPDLVAAWSGCDIRAAVEARLGMPTLVLNDAEVHGAGVVTGSGVELVLTLGTGLGTAVFQDGVPMPHLELALMPFHGKGTFQDHLGNATRRRIGNRGWSKRVLEAVEMFDGLLHFDHLYVGGGNAKKLKVDLGHRATIVDNAAGILGGIRLWDIAEI